LIELRPDAEGPSPFPRLFSPLRVGPVELANRLVLSPMTTGFGFDQGAPTDDFVAYVAARSHGVAMTVVAFGAVRPEGRVEQQVPWMWREGAAEALTPIPIALRAVGAVPCIQLGHGGRQVSPRVIGRPPVAPSPVPPRVHVTEPPIPLETGEVEEIIAAFGSAAAVAAEAGFEAVELHAAHGYLVHQFLSVESNQRTDRFGGETFSERARFGIEVIEAIRSSAPSLAVLARINGADYVPDGLTTADAAEVAACFADAGAHAIVVSGGVYGSVPYTIPLLDDPEGTFLDGATAVRAALPNDVPVVAVGRLAMPRTAEDALAAGRCDAVAIGRALLADPEWVAKARRGATSEIRPCIATVQGCAGALQHGDPISCTVNPDVGRELRPVGAAGEAVPEAAVGRRVLVVGGGPAGLETARRAAELGHRVTLVEAEDALGGAARLSAATPPLAHVADLVAWFERELTRLGVEILLGVDGATFDRSGFDDVVVAVGAATSVPPLDGYEHLACWTVEDLLAGRPSTFDTVDPPRTIVIAGAGERGLAAALWLASTGRTVTIVSDGPVGADTSGLARRAFLARLTRNGVPLLRGSVESLGPGGVAVTLDDGSTTVVPAEAFVLAGAQRPQPSPVAGAVRIGDGRSPRGMGAAIAEGRDAAERLGSDMVVVGSNTGGSSDG
jgi:2,4-dienoyl-CoA reductase-like NADH-dependent reductase (Old Yellow Enzyme family)/NADPH-dependent 2,4-dienoyl-CoA reductase/sulfur reductase-like enzyme